MPISHKSVQVDLDAYEERMYHKLIKLTCIETAMQLAHNFRLMKASNPSFKVNWKSLKLS
jgi:hypothetical protein